MPPKRPEDIQIQLAYPGRIEAFVLPFISLRELLKSSIPEAQGWAAYWEREGYPEASRAVEKMVAHGNEVIDWLDECRMSDTKGEEE